MARENAATAAKAAQAGEPAAPAADGEAQSAPDGEAVKKKGSRALDPSWTPRQRFEHVAGLRGGGAVHSIRLLGEIKAANNMEYKAEDVEKLRNNIKAELDKACDKMLSQMVFEPGEKPSRARIEPFRF